LGGVQLFRKNPQEAIKTPARNDMTKRDMSQSMEGDKKKIILPPMQKAMENNMTFFADFIVLTRNPHKNKPAK
jgi:hypothetical protein